MYDDLIRIVKPLYKYYDIDKIKPYAVYVWDKEDDKNIFDICDNEIVLYEDVEIIEEAKPIIKKIQQQLKIMKGEKYE